LALVINLLRKSSAEALTQQDGARYIRSMHLIGGRRQLNAAVKAASPKSNTPKAMDL
jgi:hypothetical protein